ncbi:hypothetical protein BJ912DRAFT_938213 [Pholiota molesta]|nr:hypothetical protein BJ912DRAFT_938213 [Pholiota molesta]
MSSVNLFPNFLQWLSRLEQVVKTLPKSIPLAKKSDAIFTVFQNIPIPEDVTGHFEAFNCGMDALFGNDATDAGYLLWNIAILKVDRLIEEIEIISAPATDEGCVLNSDGEEITEVTELGEKVHKKCAAAKKRKTVPESTSTKHKGKEARKVKKMRLTQPKPKKKPVEKIVIDSGDESNGLTAMRDIKEQEDSQGLRRGPANQSLQHFYDPLAVVMKDGSKQWQFNCRHCKRQRVVRTVDGRDISFNDEPTLPKLNNLAMHSKVCLEKNAKLANSDDEAPDQDTKVANLQRSIDMLSSYLKDGELNPAIIPDQSGFYRIFSAWVLDESLPWMTGEVKMLNKLFCYIKCDFSLPTDTTGRNYLEKIFTELNTKVVRELTELKSKIAYSTDTWTTRQMVYTFACTIAAFINADWELVERVVDFKPLAEKEHEGQLGGLAFVFLAGMDEAEDPDTFDWFEVNKGAAVLYDPASDEDQLAMEAEELEEGSQLNPMALDVDVAANEKGEAEKLAAQELAVIKMDELEQLTGQSPIKCISHTLIIHQLSTYSCHIQLRFITMKIVSSPQWHTLSA